jgi:hypothetical protein
MSAISHPNLRVPRTTVYEMAGISHTTHDNWVQEGLLAPPSKRGLSQVEALGVLVLSRLVRELDSDHGRLAWHSVGPQLLRTEAEAVDLIYELGQLRTSLAESDAELAVAVRDKGKVQVMRLEIGRWRSGLARMAEIAIAARAARASPPGQAGAKVSS